MRNNKVLSIRPDLSHLEISLSSPAEQFQNKTLRPILKLQHDILLWLVADYAHFDTLKHQAKTEEIYKAGVIHFIKDQIALKNQIIGMIAGHFTKDEWEIYSIDKNEYNKRILQMAGERIAGACWAVASGVVMQ
jgi:hypothetical protein